MELTNDEKRLLKEIVEAWESEGCFTTMPDCWARNDRGGTTTPTREDKEEGVKRFATAMKGINEKVGFALFTFMEK